METWGGGLIYLFVAYSGGVSMFIHRFRPSSRKAEFVQPFPLLVPHVTEQSIPCFLHEHLWEPQSDLQLHLQISNKDK